MMARRLSAQRAFTLMEMLVVMLIASMVVTALFEALSFVSRTQTAADEQLRTSQSEVLFRQWFQNTINGLQPDQADGKAVFRGQSDVLSGQSTGVPGAEPGVIAPVKLEFTYDDEFGETTLWQVAPKGKLALDHWSGQGAHFAYFDSDGKVHDSWPPPLGKWSQLPTAVRITLPSSAGTQDIYAEVLGPLDPKVPLKLPFSL